MPPEGSTLQSLGLPAKRCKWVMPTARQAAMRAAVSLAMCGLALCMCERGAAAWQGSNAANAPDNPGGGTANSNPEAAPAANPQAAAGVAGAEGAAANPAGDKDASAFAAGGSFTDIILSGGPFGQAITFSIFALSIVALALVVEHALTIRAKVFMPPGLAEDLRQSLAGGDAAKAMELARQDPSFLAYVVQTGLTELDGGWSAVEKALEDALADYAARLARKIEYLSVIANIAPMLGLLGTVFGMVLAFRQVAATEGVARAADLANGIYQALVTTVAGLVVAIPSLGAYAIFRSRVDQLVAETAYQALHVFTPLKRRRNKRSKEEQE